MENSAKWIQLTKNKQIIGNQGLHFVAFMLSRRGFYLAITARNAKGADILIYNDECYSVRTIQVKSLTDRYSVNVGGAKNEGEVPRLICDYWIFVNLGYVSPRCNVSIGCSPSFNPVKLEVQNNSNPGDEG